MGELNAAVGAGGGRALHRDDLPDRRPRARGGLPGVRPRHRAEAQAAPERDPRAATSTRRIAHELPARPLPRLRPRPGEPPRPLSARRTSPARPQLAELEQQYQKIIGAMTVTVPGPGADPGPDGPVPGGDRPAAPPGGLGARRRPPAGRPGHARRPVRPDDRSSAVEIAQEAGFANLRRLRVPPPRAVRLRRSPTRSGSTRRSSDVVVPLAREIQEERRQALGVETLRPWDLAVDPLGRPPLRPFDDVDKLAEGTETIFRDVDPELGPAVRLPAHARRCSTWPTARGRPPAATRRRSRTTGCRSSS